MYKKIRVIGDGAYGEVWEAEKDGKRYAIKLFFLQFVSKDIPGSVNLKEIDFAQRCDHTSILNPVEILLENPFDEPLHNPNRKKFDKIFLVSELREDSAHKFIRSKKIKTAHLKRIFFQLLCGISYLHEHNSVYRDIKGANVLIYYDDVHPNLINAEWCDLGMCKPLTSNYLNSTHISTAPYKAPEILLGDGNYGKPVDIWALGVFFFELFNEDYPFAGKNDLTVIRSIFASRGKPSKELYEYLVNGETSIISLSSTKSYSKTPISSHFKDSYNIQTFEGQPDDDKVPNFGTLDQYSNLLERMLDLDPRKRPTISEVINDPFFADIPRDDPEDKWFGLTSYKPSMVIYHTLEITEDFQLRSIGLTKVLKKMSLSFDTLAMRIVFLALDIYDRCLINAENINEEDVYYIACASCHIACKYFKDEETPLLSEVLPSVEISREKLVSWETIILRDYLNFKIYRPTVYDLLTKKSKANILLKTLMNKSRVYGYPVNVIAEIFEDTSDEL